jgi:hypothetical protein
MKEEKDFIELLEKKTMNKNFYYEIVKVHTTTGEKWSFMVWHGIKIVAKGENFKTQSEVEEVITLMQTVSGWEVEEI